MVISEDALRAKLEIVLPHLNERQRRILVGAEARAIGRGGIALVAKVTGMSRSTLQDAVAQVDEQPELSGRIRRPGGGRKRLTDEDPTLLSDLDALVDPDSRGDPESPLRWTSKSMDHLAAALHAKGHKVSPRSVYNLLLKLRYSMQANAKNKEGKQHADRDAQFNYLNEQAKSHLDQAQPVISVDTKKKELVGGPYKNGGREWEPVGSPTEVDVHDFPDPLLGKAIPYGVYDPAQNAGWVNVGTDHDTAAFAVQSVRRWWEMVGAEVYPEATRLLITADSGGSNNPRVRLWKTELVALAEQTGLDITVCHLPPGTSKWNKIEHRLFSNISMNWRGRPLTSHEVIVDLIGSTTTRTGLKVQAELDRGSYPTRIKVPDQQLADAEARMTKHTFHGERNYTVHPQPRDRGP